MYRELHPLRQALATEVSATLPGLAGVEPDKLLASYLGLTTSKHISGTSLYQARHITQQGSPNARYAAVNLAGFLVRTFPRYPPMYQSIRQRKPPRKGHFVALVAVARDFVTNVLYDMLTNHRPFFIEVEAYRKYR